MLATLTFHSMSVNGLRLSELVETEQQFLPLRDIAVAYFHKHEETMGISMAAHPEVVLCFPSAVQRTRAKVFPTLGLAPIFLSDFNLTKFQEEYALFKTADLKLSIAGASELV